jgi:NAD(P)H-dependent flavin oxidoreductase YrpB (nitropropane dioxygenase family)
LFPQVLAAVRSARRINLPLIAGAGLFQQAHAEAVLAAGAAAVQLDAVLWRGWMEG